MPTRAVRDRLALVVAALGGVVFVGALATGAWFYARRLAPAAGTSAMTLETAARNLGLFVAFALHHSVMARSGAKRWLMRRLPPALERSAYVWIASLLFFAVCFGWVPTTDVAWHWHGAAAWTGWAAQGLGLAVTALGARVLDPLELAGIRQVLHATGAPVVSEPLDAISRRGPYGLVRHPIYLGWILLVWPTPVMSSGRLLFAAVSTLYLLVAIPLEERSLSALHPVDDPRYKQDVRWRVIPGLY